MSETGSSSATPTTPHRSAMPTPPAGSSSAGRATDTGHGMMELLERLSNNMEMMADRFDDFGIRLEHLEHRTPLSAPPLITTAAAAPVAQPSVTFQLPPTTASTFPPPPATVNIARSTRGRGLPPHMRSTGASTSSTPAPAEWTPAGTIWGPPTATAAPPTATSREPQNPSQSPGPNHTPSAASSTSRPTPRDVFRALPTADKEIFRRALELMGQSTRDYLNKVNRHRVPTDAVQQAQLGLGADGQDDNDDDDTLDGSSFDHSTLECKKELLGVFKGDPTRLEKFLGRVKNVERSEQRPELRTAWTSAVLRAIPLALEDDAAEWNEGLTDQEAKALDTVDAWADAMRQAFPPNQAQQRREARELKWEPGRERSAAYYFRKLRAVRQAFGNGQSEEALVTDIRDGLPASFIAMLRLPRGQPRLQDLRQELGEWEPTWRELSNTPLNEETVASENAPDTHAKTSQPVTTTTSARRPTLQAMVRSASAPNTTRANPATASSSPLGAFSLAATYDPTRVTPAANGRPRTYRRPDRDTIMTLNRACTRCGQDHFNFEHDHLMPQVRTATGDDDDYPEEAVDDHAGRDGHGQAQAF
ncbi:hypothetical protein OC835_007316 [Tilletia horrida]|nr:hypothetical protein OC835_007316 [Tilletia horrida]